MDETALVEIGLSKTESKIYLALLKNGLSTVTEIAKETKIHRANIYETVKKLLAKGLISYIKQESGATYEAAEPQALLNMIKDKENKLNVIMPQLLLHKKMAESKGEANIYEGLNGLMNQLYDMLKYDDDIRVYGIPTKVPEIVRTKIPHFHRERLAKKVNMLHIYNYSAQDRITFLNKMKYTEAKFLPESFDSQVSTFVCGEEIMLVLWLETIITIKIKNKQVANAYKNYFKLLWAAAKKF